MSTVLVDTMNLMNLMEFFILSRFIGDDMEMFHLLTVRLSNAEFIFRTSCPSSH